MTGLTGSQTEPQVSEGLSVGSQDESAQTTAALAPTFNGKLNMSGFVFSPKGNGEPRRASLQEPASTSGRQSPRLAAQNSNAFTLLAMGAKRKSTEAASLSSSKKSRSSSGYAPPSTYAHLPVLPDSLTPNLICVFVGLNPGVRTATEGYAYAHPSNLFWKLLHSSGCTPRRCLPSETHDLPRLFALGNTNIVERPTKNGAELSKQEMDESVAALNEKIRINKPEMVCIVGKSIWESIWRVKHGKPMKKADFKYGWQDEVENMGQGGKDETGDRWKGTNVFVATSTSGLAASPPQAEKERIWRELGVRVEQRRGERAIAPPRDIAGDATR